MYVEYQSLSINDKFFVATLSLRYHHTGDQMW